MTLIRVYWVECMECKRFYCVKGVKPTQCKTCTSTKLEIVEDNEPEEHHQ